MSLDEPPMYAPIVNDDGKATIPWALFFGQTAEGDFGNTWLPNFKNLTVSGTPTITGRYFVISKQMAVFWVKVTPSISTSAAAGTTYIDNFPLTATADGFCIAVSGGQGGVPGMIDASNNRIYTPAWSGVTLPVTVIGFAFAE